MIASFRLLTHGSLILQDITSFSRSGQGEVFEFQIPFIGTLAIISLRIKSPFNRFLSLQNKIWFVVLQNYEVKNVVCIPCNTKCINKKED